MKQASEIVATNERSGALRARFKRALQAILPRKAFRLGRMLTDLRSLRECFRFMRNPSFRLSSSARLGMLIQFHRISMHVHCPHTQEQILEFVSSILGTPDTVRGHFVEAGCYKGGSTAKFGLAAHAAQRSLVVFDSFQGLPVTDESHDADVFGHPTGGFQRGDYRGTRPEVDGNLRTFGKPEVCTLIEGWFEETMPAFREPLAGIYLDVDLVSSTRTCLKHLYPLLQSGGVLFSQDGHLPLVLRLFEDETFWKAELGCEKPHIIGLGKSKLISIRKP